MKKISIGFDLGVASVGWSVLDVDNLTYLDYGVKIFEQSNKAEDRRKARSLRRRYKRKFHRLERFDLLLNGLELAHKKNIDPELYLKRVKGLREEIGLDDIFNILSSMLKRRGYQPTGTEKRESAYRDKYPSLHPCEIQKILMEKVGSYRGTSNPFLVSEFKKEINCILENQKKYHEEINDDFIRKYFLLFNSRRKFWEGPGGPRIDQLTKFGRFQTKEDIENYKKDSLYNKFLYEKLIKNCSIYEGEKSADVNNYYAQYFNLFNDLVNISVQESDELEHNKYLDLVSKDIYKLTLEGIEKVIKQVLNSDTINWKSIFKKSVDLDVDLIRGARIDSSGKIELTRMDFLRVFLKKCKEFNYDYKLDEEGMKKYNLISRMLTVSPEENIKEMIELNKNEYKLKEEDIKVISSIKDVKKKIIKQYHSYSEKALKTFLFYMKKDVKNSVFISREYAEEISGNVEKNKIKNYFSSNSKKMSKKFIDDLVASPQVKKTLRKSINTLNEIIDIYLKKEKCQIEYICIESNAELLSEKKIEDYIKNQDGNRKKREKYLKLGFSEQDTLKSMLLDETNSKCIYCEKPLNLENMEIEHIIPYSISADNSFGNKTSSCVKCNKDKGQKTPFLYLGDFNSFEKKVANLDITAEKRRNLLTKEDINKYQKKFINRNLRDTSYATKELITQLKIYQAALQELGEVERSSFKVVSMPPKVTGLLRQSLVKDRSTDFHHAVDASLCAFYPLTGIGKISVQLNNDIASFWKGNSYKEFLTKENLKMKLPNSIGSQLAQIKQDNVKLHIEVKKRSNKQLANADISKVLVKKNESKYLKIEYFANIYEIKKKDLKIIFNMLSGKNTSNILGLQYNDKDTFDLFKKIYEEYKDEKRQYFVNKDGKSVWCNPFKLYCIEEHELAIIDEFDYKLHGIRPQSKKGKVRPVIKKLRYSKNVTSPYLLEKKSINLKDTNHIMLDSIAQSHTEVYKNLDKGGFLFLPVYLISMDLKKNTVNKDNKFYKELKNKFLGNTNVEFIFSVNTNEYLRGKNKKGEIVEGLYSGFDKTNNLLKLKRKKRITRSLVSIEKIDIYGLGVKGLDFARK